MSKKKRNPDEDFWFILMFCVAIWALAFMITWYVDISQKSKMFNNLSITNYGTNWEKENEK